MESDSRGITTSDLDRSGGYGFSSIPQTPTRDMNSSRMGITPAFPLARNIVRNSRSFW